MYWNTQLDEPYPKQPDAVHEFARPWVLWDRCYELAPEACQKFARGLWEHQIANQATGAFDRHAKFWSHGPADNMDYPRHAGFYIRTWADAYAHTQDMLFLDAIETLVNRYEKKRHRETLILNAHRRQICQYANSRWRLTARRGPPRPKYSPRALRFVNREDELFCRWKHEVAGGGGFVVEADRLRGRPPRSIARTGTPGTAERLRR
jgi:hypothetical protein